MTESQKQSNHISNEASIELVSKFREFLCAICPDINNEQEIIAISYGESKAFCFFPGDENGDVMVRTLSGYSLTIEALSIVSSLLTFGFLTEELKDRDKELLEVAMDNLLDVTSDHDETGIIKKILNEFL